MKCSLCITPVPLAMSEGVDGTLLQSDEAWRREEDSSSDEEIGSSQSPRQSQSHSEISNNSSPPTATAAISSIGSSSSVCSSSSDGGKGKISTVVPINSVAEASCVISNLRKLRCSNRRQNNSGQNAEEAVQALQSVKQFDRMVRSSCIEIQREAERGKRIDEKLVNSISTLNHLKESSSGNALTKGIEGGFADVIRTPGNVHSVNHLETQERSSEEFRAALLQRLVMITRHFLFGAF